MILKRLLKRLSVLVFFCICYFFSSTALATDTAVPTNPTTTSPDTLDLSDGTITNPQYGCPSGTTAAQVNTSNWGTETVRFGECVNTFAITYAINQALQGSGVSIDKVHYSWRYVMCFNKPGDSCNTNLSNRVNVVTGEVTDDTYFDELQVVIEVTDSNGNVVETKTWNMDTWYQWNGANLHSDNEIKVGSVYWQIEEGNIEVYNHIDKTGTIRTPNSVGDVRFRISGYDKGNWDGYYGPVINRLQTWFTYRANPCNDTALYDPSCPGYATALAAYQYDQNCAANALYDPGCPGYAQANYNAQCSADPLYDSGCPGYADAYYTQQCSADPLYDSGCNGYAAAYLAQQCSLDAHYDSSCTGYSSAVTELTSDGTNVAGQGSDFVEVTKANNSTLYWILYYNQAEINAGGWKWECTGTSCTDDHGTISSVSVQGSGTGTHMFLYTKNASGNTVQPDNNKTYKFFKSSYLTTQCNANALYSVACDGYAAAYFTQQCDANALYNSECSGYAAAYLEQQCSISALHSTSCSGYAAAYLTQQCNLDTLYNSACPGYDAAYLTQQCSLDVLYDEACSGYDAAYLTQQCALDSTHDESCTGYEEAYFEQQCILDALHSPGCSGYDTAYLNQQCSYNSQYDPECPGYVEPIVETDISDIGLGTGDSIVDSVISVPDLPIMIIPMPEVMPEPEPEPEPEIVIELPTIELPNIGTIDNTITVPEPLDEVEQIELEVEQQIELELSLPEVELEIEPEVEMPNETQGEEESSGDVEQSMDGDTESDENDNQGGTEDTSSDEVSEGDTTEEAVEETEPEEEAEESTEEEATEETEEESTEEESTDEEETTEEESNEEATEEDESEEENSEESEEETTEEVKEEKVAEAKPKKVKKLSKKEKEAAKRKKMKEIIKDKLKKLAEDQGKATSLEAQQALQRIIAALINYVPGFNAYGEMAIPGVDFYNSDGIYLDKKIPENQRGLLNGLASELKWNKMVDEQYEGME